MPFSAAARLSPPPVMSNTQEWQRKAVLWMAQAHNGHIANTGVFTADSGTAETVLTDSRIGFASCILFAPTTANAATELGAGTLYISTQSAGAATVTHANAVTGDRTFRYAILG